MIERGEAVDLPVFIDRFRTTVAGLRGRLDDVVLRDVLTYLDNGEEGLAVEFLMGGLIRGRIPVSRAEVATLLDLMRWFDLPPDDTAADFYSALTDPDGTATELTVVDEPS